jgi:hypothetical protein
MDDGRPVVAFGSGELIKLQKLCAFVFNFSCNIPMSALSINIHTTVIKRGWLGSH